MEVAGLVLGVVGALPMIVQVVQGYQMISESGRLGKYMAMLEANLETEKLIPGEIYLELLNGIVPACELDDLKYLEDTSDEWKTYDDQIRMRLQKSYDTFKFSANAIKEAVEDLTQMLPRPTSREVLDKNWSSKLSALASEAKFRTSASLKKKNCDDALSKIRENNTRLSLLVSRRVTSEPNRRANSQSKIARAVRITSQGLFSALSRVIRCKCIESHRLGLHVQQRMDEDGPSQSFKMIFGTTNDLHKHNLRFDLLEIQWKQEKIVSSGRFSSKGASHSLELLSPDNQGASAKKAGFSLGSRSGEASRSPSPLKSKRRQKVRFSEIPSDDSSTEHSRGKSIAAAVTVPQITDLCAYIQRGEVMTKHPFGFIPCVEAPEGFDLYYLENPPSFNTESVILRDVLKDSSPDEVKLELHERLNVALALSFGMLQLCNTQWLGSVITLDHIVLDCLGQNIDQPFLFLVRQPLTDSSSAKPAIAVNFALLSLGVVLTQLIMGRQFEAIDVSEDMTKEILLSKRDAACHEVEICGVASKDYVDAVRWCWQECFTYKTLADDKLSRLFHDCVIEKLQGDLRSIHELNI